MSMTATLPDGSRPYVTAEATVRLSAQTFATFTTSQQEFGSVPILNLGRMHNNG
jgi:hypothetical protein